jgi:hypothetical protein
MRTFGNYPIKINYNRHTQLRYKYKEELFHQAKQFKEERQLSIQVETTSDSTIKTDNWKEEIDQYESNVYDLLQKVNGNPVGRMVLDKINKKTTVWIVPKVGGKRNEAMTGPLNWEIPKDRGSYARGEGLGDTVIQFLPEMGDDALIHELVHAYRYSYKKKWDPILLDVNDKNSDYKDKPTSYSSEELFAHEIENIYLSQAHRPLSMDYNFGQIANRQAIYDFMFENSIILMTLKWFLHHEHLAMVAAHSFATDYNPFRDYKELEAKWLSSSSVSELPELGTMLKN